jgi:hypothetical protein
MGCGAPASGASAAEADFFKGFWMARLKPCPFKWNCRSFAALRMTFVWGLVIV